MVTVDDKWLREVLYGIYHTVFAYTTIPSIRPQFTQLHMDYLVSVLYNYYNEHPKDELVTKIFHIIAAYALTLSLQIPRGYGGFIDNTLSGVAVLVEWRKSRQGKDVSIEKEYTESAFNSKQK